MGTPSSCAHYASAWTVLFSMISNSRGTRHRISAPWLMPLGFGSRLIDGYLEAPEPQLVHQVVRRNE